MKLFSASVIVVLFLSACSSKPAPECVYKECTCEDTLAVTATSHFFPFNGNQKVIAYEYAGSMSAVSLRLDTGNVFDSSSIKASHVLNADEILQLEKICRNRTEKCNDYTCEDGNDCLYDPHHCIVFYEGEKPVAYLEMCFICDDSREWPYGEFGTMCGDFMYDLRWFLRKLKFDDAPLYFDHATGYEADTVEVWKGHFTKTP